MTPPTHQLHARVHGTVQGVSFRYYTTQRATQLRVRGWVRNNPDRTVETLAQGSKEALEAFLAFLREGSPAAHVTHVEFTWSEPDEVFSSFRTVYH
jgi:acylphosphatase